MMYELKDFMNSASYKLLEYGTLIQDNTFSNNYSGMKGSALLIERISEVQIKKNIFMDNGPVTAAKEMEFSPYYRYLAGQERTISFYVPDTGCKDEAEYFDKYRKEGERIDMPQLQGAIYIKNCFD